MAKKKISFTIPIKENLEQQVDDWVKLGSLTNDNISKTDLYRLSLDLPKFLHRRIKKACAMEGISMKDKLNDILLKAFPEN